MAGATVGEGTGLGDAGTIVAEGAGLGDADTLVAEGSGVAVGGTLVTVGISAVSIGKGVAVGLAVSVTTGCNVGTSVGTRSGAGVTCAMFRPLTWKKSQPVSVTIAHTIMKADPPINLLENMRDMICSPLAKLVFPRYTGQSE